MTELPTHYVSSSKGAVEIATMEHRHLVNSYDKLVRDADPEREAERKAMARQIAINNEAYAEAEAAKAQIGGVA